MKRPGKLMRTDDQLGIPGARVARRNIGYLLAVAVVLLVVGIVSVALVLNTQAQLSQTEVAQLRTYLGERAAQRDAERAEVQGQLDRQARAFCEALAAFRDSADPAVVSRLGTAEQAIGCAHLAQFGTLNDEPDGPSSLPATP